jgi:hypothetical protein
MTSMMKYGYKQYITEDDLWNLAKRDTTRTTGDIFQDAWNYELKDWKHPSLWAALFRGFSGLYFVTEALENSFEGVGDGEEDIFRKLESSESESKSEYESILINTEEKVECIRNYLILINTQSAQ